MPFSKRKLFYCLSNIMNRLLLMCQQYCNILWSNTDWPGTLQTTNSMCNQQTIMFWNISLLLPSTLGVRFNFTWRNYNKWAETKGYWSDITSSRKTEILKMHIASAVYFPVQLIFYQDFFSQCIYKSLTHLSCFTSKECTVQKPTSAISDNINFISPQ